MSISTGFFSSGSNQQQFKLLSLKHARKGFTSEVKKLSSQMWGTYNEQQRASSS